LRDDKKFKRNWFAVNFNLFLSFIFGVAFFLTGNQRRVVKQEHLHIGNAILGGLLELSLVDELSCLVRKFEINIFALSPFEVAVKLHQCVEILGFTGFDVDT